MKQEPITQRAAILKRTLITIVLLSTMAVNTLSYTEEDFPDPVFRQYLIDVFDAYEDTESDKYYFDIDVNSITAINVSGLNITNLKGIEKFKNLASLNCANCPIKEFSWGYSNKNQLTNINVTSCAQLEKFNCRYQNITELDFTGCSSLKVLYIPDNYNLTSVYLSTCSELEELDCNNCSLTELDLSNCKKLKKLDCGRDGNRDQGQNSFTLDVSNCTQLEELYCDRLIVDYSQGLDVSMCPNLKVLSCNWVTFEFINAAGCDKLEQLEAWPTGIGKINLSNCSALQKLNILCHYSFLDADEQVDLSDCINLEYLCYGEGNLIDIDLSNNTKLKELHLDKNHLLYWNLKNNPLIVTKSAANQTSSQPLEALDAEVYGMKVPEAFDVSKVTGFVVNGEENIDEVIKNEDGYLVFTSTVKPKSFTYVYDEVMNVTVKVTKISGYEPPSLNPVKEGAIIIPSFTVSEMTDFRSIVVKNIYFNLDADEGEGYDVVKNCIVLNKSISETDMEAVAGEPFGSKAFVENFDGIVIKIPAGTGTLSLDALTLGSATLNILVGATGETFSLSLSERERKQVVIITDEETYVYIYKAESMLAKTAMAKAAATANGVEIYALEWNIGDVTGIQTVKQLTDKGSAKNTIYNLNGQHVTQAKASGIYIVNGEKVVIK